MATLAISLAAGAALAREVPLVKTSAPAVPFQLRGTAAVNGARIDTVFTHHSRDGATGFLAVTLVTGQARVAEHVALQFKWGAVHHQPNLDRASRAGVLNPVLGALFALPIDENWRLAASIGLGLPLGSGGGDERDPETARMQRLGALARSSLDNTSFAVNDVGFPIAVSSTYFTGPLTCQLDGSVIPSVRARGAQVQADAHKVNATTGLFVGFFVLPELSVGFELRYQRYLSTPATVVADGATRDHLTAAVGARWTAELSGGAKFRPALSFAQSLSGAGRQEHIQTVQLDLPVVF